ncbi:DUF6191 domain-containing protein [Streptomyces sp. NPDC094049]|uniref:DUF6191 domain-containing protein n=1 Tax=Streptomyces sp. NPDC094049 TaxID=3154987 RepID=UPI003323BAB8
MAELFAPGRRHTTEELRRQALTREDPGDADPSRGPIDLRSGRVTIRLPGGPESPVEGPAREVEASEGPAREVEASEGPAGEVEVSEGPVEEVETVGEGGGLTASGDTELGEDVGDVDAGRLR